MIGGDFAFLVRWGHVSAGWSAWTSFRARHRILRLRHLCDFPKLLSLLIHGCSEVVLVEQEVHLNSDVKKSRPIRARPRVWPVEARCLLPQGCISYTAVAVKPSHSLFRPPFNNFRHENVLTRRDSKYTISLITSSPRRSLSL